MSLLLRDAAYVDWRTLAMRRGDIRVAAGPGGGLEFPAGAAAAARPGETVRECGGRLVTRAFVCGHHHAYSALARGMPAPQPPPANFLQTLQRVWWRLDRALDAAAIEASALVTAVQAARHGVTFVIDHHSSPRAAAGSLEIIARAFDRVGVGHLLCLEMSDRDGAAACAGGLAESERHLASGRPALVGLHASFTVGDELLGRAVALARRFGSGIHIHAAEDPVDQRRTVRRHRQRVLERLAAAGALDLPRTILAHGLHLNEREKALLAGSPAWLAENVESNLNNRVGTFDGRGLGNRIMLGTDGMHSDMLRAAQWTHLAGAGREGLDMAGAYGRLRAGHRYLAENGFAGDGDNNLVVLDYDPPTPIEAANFLGHFFYGLEARHVTAVVARGRLIVDGHRLLSADEGEINAFAREQAVRLWDRLRGAAPA